MGVGGGGVASMSLYDKVQKGLLVGSVTQGPKGWWGSSGSQGSKTSDRGRGRNTRQKRRRYADGRRIKKEENTNEVSTRIRRGSDTQIPDMPSPNNTRRGEGKSSRLKVRGERETISLSFHMNKMSFDPISDLHK